ncbi:MBL fold metallo-hydrolase [Paenibacillus doosanensis]|uniref:Ribonuclease Z n=1 Tax=Paenibacillus konkukensis TaxID=2020716 RepID=A0ABY4RVK5_9BACL|nr:MULTISPECIES: MBL fold metallo-hydrolase [Paenibacillus]MCS7458773.1 MBL fold metallo-hydrolase [Paenibacillus doosanensis]UQZ86701.1 ribonuclease Z [Paenibacillus konkukensis]
MNLYTLHKDTFIQVKVPLPFPLRWVNAYLIRGKDGYTLIDPGLHTEAAEEMWEAVMKELGFGFADIEQLVLTHHHPDHYGLAGWFQERSGAPVRLSAVGCGQVKRLWGEAQPMTDELLRLFAAHGLPDELAEPMRAHMDDFVSMVSPQPALSLITPGEPIRLGDDEYETIHTPGHAAGHLCFYRRQSGDMICGDHVIPRISPNVSYLPGGIDENPLQSFLQSLEVIGQYDVTTAYPGHRDPFQTFGQRTRELLEHHDARLEQMRSLLEQGAMTAYEVCRATFGDRLTLHQLRFALSETLAHLIYLRDAQRVEQLERGATDIFQTI